VRAGDRTVGYLYNFVHRGHVMTYQAGIDYGLLPASDSPGMASHALAIEANAGLGHAVYDFMIGDQQYKRALCTGTVDQHWLVLQRDRLKFRFERTLRDMRERWKAQAAA
jgi:CelD/BcsL family acetyltransferase involved in cellulose biosynthesis